MNLSFILTENFPGLSPGDSVLKITMQHNFFKAIITMIMIIHVPGRAMAVSRPRHSVSEKTASVRG